MAAPDKEMTLDEAVNAVGQMENFFKAFRRVSDLVLFLQTAEGRRKELTGAISLLEDSLADASRQHTEKLTEMKAEQAALKAKIDKAMDVLKQIEAEGEERTAKIEAENAALIEQGNAKMEAVEVQIAALEDRVLKLSEEATEAEARVAKAKEALAAMLAAGEKGD